LLRAGDAVEIARHRLEAVVGGSRAVAEILDLLQHRIGPAVGENIAGQQEQRQAVDMGHRRRRHHVKCPRPDRGGASHHAPPPHCLGEGDRRMGHGLLVMGAVGRQFSSDPEQGLADPRHIAVTEDRPDSGEERQLLAIDDGHLAGEEFHQRLRRGEADGLGHRISPARRRASRAPCSTI
jgi:hypothetical protein